MSEQNTNHPLATKRSEPRVAVRWPAIVTVEGRGDYHGHTKDVSSKGASVFLEFAIPNIKIVKLQIRLPPNNNSNDPHIVEVSGNVVYTTFVNKEFLFLTGLKFRQFSSETDLVYLQFCILQISSKTTVDS